jgi:hypothetical protein
MSRSARAAGVTTRAVALPPHAIAGQRAHLAKVQASLAPRQAARRQAELNPV